MNRNAALQVILLVVIANVTLFLPQMFNYPYSEIPDFYAHLGRATSIIQTGSVTVQYSTSYLNFPNLFVLLVQLDLTTGGGLLMVGAILPAILTTLYALLVYLIITVLCNNARIAFVASFVAITTNAAINVIFVAPGYLNWVLILVAEYLTWKLLITVNNFSSKSLIPILLVSVTFAMGDPIYSLGYAITLLFLFLFVYISNRKQETVRRLYKIILVSVLPSALYYLYVTKWVIAQLPGYITPFLRSAFGNFLFTVRVPNQGGNTYLSEWLSTAHLASRIIYFLVAVSGLATIFWILVMKRSLFASGKILAANIALAATLSGAIFFGFGEGVSSFAGRFQQFAYIYLSLFSVYGLFYCTKRFVRIKRYKFIKFIGVFMMISVVLLYLPIHFNFASVGELPFYSAKYYVDRGTVVYTPEYRPAIMGVLGFFTGYDWLSGPASYPHNIPLNITTLAPTNSYYNVNVVYNNGGEIMEIPR